MDKTPPTGHEDIEQASPQDDSFMDNFEDEPVKDKKKMKMATTRQVFAYIETRQDKLIFVAGCVAAVLNGTILPATAYTLSSSFSELGGAGDTMVKERAMTTITDIAYKFMVLGVAAFVFSTVEGGCFNVVASRSMKTFSCRWFETIVRKEQAFFDTYDVSGLANSIGPNAKKLRHGIRMFGACLQCFTVVVLSITYAFYSSWKLALVILALFPFTAMSGLMVLKHNESQSARAAASYNRAGSIAYTTVSSIRTVLALNIVADVLSKYFAATKEAYIFATSPLWRQGLINGSLMGSLVTLCAVLTLFGSYLIYDDVRDTGCDPSGGVPGVDTCDESGPGVHGAFLGVVFAAQCMSVLVRSIEAFTAARIACYSAISVMNHKVSLNSKRGKNIMPDLAENGSIQATKGDDEEVSTIEMGLLPSGLKIDAFSQDGLKPEGIEGAISYHNVCFWYPARPDHLIFNKFSLDIMPGTTVALVGPSGGGKSTAIALLERFYDPAFGSVFLDGVNIKDINVKHLRAQLGYVGQEPTLFGTTIAENIRCGCPDATMKQITNAAKASNAHDFIMSFPNGYDTHVGNKGTQLSGGQKQRIAIARALVSNPKILLLDEATSALDSESEHVVQQALDNLLVTQMRTTIVIAHRLSTIRDVDQIVFIKDGQVVEIGTHDKLMEAKTGHYRCLVEEHDDSCEGEQDLSNDPNEGDLSETPSAAHLSLHTIANTSSKQNINNIGKMEMPLGQPYQLSFKNVSFSYPSRREKQIFCNFCLKVQRGEMLALVGPSGGGKSTTFALIERFYDPDEGVVEFEGTNLKELNVRWLRDQIGYVEQEPTLFNATIAENIAYGFPEATQERIEEVAKIVSCHDFITRFPRGYNTMVGTGGAQLSGGQKQRIAIARAIVKSPKILLLDEATSALDNESEAIIQEALNELMASGDLTVLVIAHRLSTIKNADRIAFITDGAVEEVGPHSELMKVRDGCYRRLVEMQRRGSMLDLDIGETNSKDTEEHETKEELSSSFKKNNNVILRSDEEKKDVPKSFNLKRARELSMQDFKFIFMGGAGAMLSGAVFPAWGVLFGLMIELLFQRVYPCPGVSGFNLLEIYNVDSCEEYYAWVAEDMQAKSIKLASGFCSILVACLLGNILLFIGFGVAGERFNKRIRDSSFRSLICQEVAYFDTHNIGSITTQLQEDAAKLHALSVEPVRTAMSNIGTVCIGLVISFFFMWPFTLLTVALVPFLAFSAILRMRTFLGTDKNYDEPASEIGSSGAIALETLSSIRTIAALGLEEARYEDYVKAVQSEEPNTVFESFKKGAMGGLAMFINQWSNALQIWFGGWLLFTYNNKFDFRDFSISIFCLKLSLFGLGANTGESQDQKECQEAAGRIFDLIEKKSVIDPLSETGLKLQ